MRTIRRAAGSSRPSNAAPPRCKPSPCPRRTRRHRRPARSASPPGIPDGSALFPAPSRHSAARVHGTKWSPRHASPGNGCRPCRRPFQAALLRSSLCRRRGPDRRQCAARYALGSCRSGLFLRRRPEEIPKMENRFRAAVWSGGNSYRAAFMVMRLINSVLTGR